MPDRRDDILAHVNHPNYRPVKPKVIAKKIGAAEEGAAEAVRKTIKRMVKEGLLAFGPEHLVYALQHPPAPSPAAGMEQPSTVASGYRAMGGRTALTSDGPGTQGITPPPSPPPQGEGGGTSNAKLKHKRDHEHIVGTFRRAEAGFGFVRPEGTLKAAGRDSDIFIPAKYTFDAANGDTVSVRLSSRVGRMGKVEGRIIDVVDRATSRFVGTYLESAGMALVQVDGKIFSNPVYVGDPGAKGVQPDDKVVIDMVRFPSHARDGEAVIVEVLGQRGMPGVDTLSIMHEFALPGPFAEDALEEARRQAEKFDESIGTESSGVDRRDLTTETIITIDPATARDFDDAISLERIDNGHWMLGVHIADVSHFVVPKTPLDREAKDRATSVYLPDRVIPMLPEIISNNLASLQPDKVRYAITARIEFTADGLRLGTDVFKSAIKSRRRFAYEEVDEYLLGKGLVERAASNKNLRSPPLGGEGPTEHGRPEVARAQGGREWDAVTRSDPLPSPPLKGEGAGGVAHLKLAPEVDALLARMFELAMMLRKRRFRRGALELAMPEIEIDLDKDGRVAGAHLAENTESHQIIEEFMLSANEAVAEKLRDADIPFIRRVHGAPDPRKLKALTAFVAELGFKTDSLESRFALQKLLDDVKGDPRQHAVNYAALRSMQRAVYSPDEEGHFALASDCYTHFTSPIRRYPDLTVHRLFADLAEGRTPEQHLESLIITGDHCSDREQRAAEAERELKKLKLLNYLADKVGMQLNGVVTGVESYGLFVVGSELPAEGFIAIGALTDDYYRFDRAGHAVHGLKSGNSFRLGDPVRVAVAAVNVDRRELDFRLIGRLGKTGSGRPRSATRKHGPAKPSAKKGPRKGGKKRRK
jgi:ribonuclease R